MKTYSMMVLGCKVNDYEATYIKQEMDKYYQEVNFKENSDICLIFTCCVTNMAEAKSRKFIHDARRRNPESYICVIGCYPQLKKDNEVFLDCDLVIGSQEKDKVVEYINEGLKANLVKNEISKKFEELYLESYPKKSRAFLKIQDGCNQFCAYCAIPYSRGRERSGKHCSLIKEAEILAKSCKEIVLTGIHTGRYNDGEFNLYQLLCELIKIEDLKTIRLSSIEITEITDEIIELMKNNDKIAHHLHIPVQSCCNKILKLMNRPYTIEEYIQRIAYIRSQIPNISISTDLIVGFPNEDEEEFKIALENLKKIKFSFIHVFPYSRKEGTLADTMANHLDPKIKKARVNAVMQLEKEYTKEFNESFIGKTVKVLIEKADEQYSYGYCKEYIYLRIKGQYKVGELVEVAIDKDNLYEIK